MADSITELKQAGEVCAYDDMEIPPLPVGAMEVQPGRFCVNVPGTWYSDRSFPDALELIRHLAEGWRAAHITRIDKEGHI